MKDNVSSSSDRVEWKDGVKYTWDKRGMCFVSIHVGNAPLANWEEWNAECGRRFSGQRWQFVYSDYHKARAYETLLEAMSEGTTMQEESELGSELLDEEGQERGVLELLNPLEER